MKIFVLFSILFFNINIQANDQVVSNTDLIINYINLERTKRNLVPLNKNFQLMTCSKDYAKLMAKKNKMSHTLGGTNAGQRMILAGYNWWNWGENVAYGYTTPKAVVTAWMNSPGHRANILGNFKDIGVGIAYSSNGTPYYCQVFGTRR